MFRRIAIAVLAAAGVGAAGAQESRIVRDVAAAAEWMAKALNSSGYRADFSITSLKELDRFFDEHSSDGKPKPGGLLSEATGQRLFGLGAYVGETIRRKSGGRWRGDDSDPEAETNVELVLEGGASLWPIQRVIKRLRNGAEDGIFAYGVATTKP
jgi:hypothetical protein